MSGATLKIDPLLNGGRRVVIECKHGTTLGGDLKTAPLAEAAVVASMALQHRLAFECECTGRLERQYPAELIPPELTIVELMA